MGYSTKESGVMTVQTVNPIWSNYSELENEIIDKYYPLGGVKLALIMLKLSGITRTESGVRTKASKRKLLMLDKKGIESRVTPFVIRFVKQHIEKYSASEIRDSLDTSLGNNVTLGHIEYIKSNLI